MRAAGLPAVAILVVLPVLFSIYGLWEGGATLFLIAALAALGRTRATGVRRPGEITRRATTPPRACSASCCSESLSPSGRWPTGLRESEALVRRQDVDLANLAQLSQYIVQHLRESILVVDSQDRIRLINESAAQITR